MIIYFIFLAKKQGEVDFLVTYKNEILPIEVKSGKKTIKAFGIR